ncbi:hypothetical protein E4U52_002915 [Claviceps spartinae]|nr:hypothetical protein E4U52_002915 [Claviceps spartinae]
MDSSHRPQLQQSQAPQEPLTLHAPLPQSVSMPLRTANSTPISSPGLFSPTASRQSLTYPHTSLSECNTPAPMGKRPWLHPLQTHRVRETHKALIDLDSINGRKTINQYEVIEEIGRGMHGKVKLARSLETGENVAIKIIPRFSKKRRLGKLTALSPQDKTKKEIAILKKIRHANVVALLEVIDDPELKKIYMVLEHVELGEIVWRKKGLPHICQYERKLVEREVAGGEAPTAEEIQYNELLERRHAIKEIKRAKMAQNFAGPSDFWSVEHGAADDRSSSAGPWSRISSQDNFAMMDRSSSPSGSRQSSAAPSRSLSFVSSNLLPSKMSEDALWVDDMETPGPLDSNTPYDNTLFGASAEEGSRGPTFRQRSSSMADSIISHMSSVDYNPFAHDPFAEDYSFVPCFTFEQARSTFRDTVLGLEYLHYQGVVHRDIKPANLLWTKDHRVKISDFGVSYFGRPIRDGEADDTVSESEAKDFDDDLELAKTVGTPAFFAPELCYTDLDSGLQPKVSEQIDVWSLGVTLYCLIYARIPFLAEDEFQMFRKIATDEVHIPRRRLKPVDPSTSPAEHSLYKRHNAHPYRDDNDLEYEDVDNLLYDLLRQMLTKNPEKRIRLRDIKRHPWVVQGIPDVVAWLEESDPAGPSQGRKIQVDEKEVSYAVIPLTLLERARSVVKKAVEKVMHPLGERSGSKPRTRKRATSSAVSSSKLSSAGEGFFRHTGAPSQHVSFERRPSIRGEDYFAPSSTRAVGSGDAGQLQTRTTSTATTVQGDDASVHDHGTRDQGGLHGSNDLSAGTSSSRRFQRHVFQNRMMPPSLELSHAHPETQSTPVTPNAGTRPFPSRQAHVRWTGPSESQSESDFSSYSIDRGMFMSPDSRHRSSSCVSVSSTAAPGTMREYHQHPGLMRSVDLGRGERRYNTSSPLSSSPQASSAALQREDARHALIVEDSELTLTLAPDTNSITEAVGELSMQSTSSQPASQACTLSSSGREMRDWSNHAAPSGDKAGINHESSSLESMHDLGTPPSTCPSETATPCNVHSAKSRSETLHDVHCDSSLPEPLSRDCAGTEAEHLRTRRLVSRQEGSSEADTPPAMAKEATPAMESDSTLPLCSAPSEDETDSSAPHADSDFDNEEGLFLVTKSTRHVPSLAAAGPRQFENRRRDTGTSSASNETAKRVSVSGRD